MTSRLPTGPRSDRRAGLLATSSLSPLLARAHARRHRATRRGTRWARPGREQCGVAQRLRERGATRVVDLEPDSGNRRVIAEREHAARDPWLAYVEELDPVGRIRPERSVHRSPVVRHRQNRAFDVWLEPPSLASVRVAVIDSGFDGTHPELRGRVVAAKSFVAGPPTVDTQGHGTFVAGLIAARTNDGVGIAGLAPPAELLIAKVVGPERSIPVEAEARAIRWAVAHGARVIDMSLGGPRDPRDPSRDTYSQLEADAVAYAVSKGVLVVAAVGNADQSPAEPGRTRAGPRAPHVLGVSALSHSGGSSSFSNRDTQFNDIAARRGHLLDVSASLTAVYPDCAEQGYSTCGPEE